MEYNKLHFILSTGPSTSTQVPEKNEIVILSDRENQFVIGDKITSIRELANNPFIAKDEILNDIGILDYKGHLANWNEQDQPAGSKGDVYIVGPQGPMNDYYWYIYGENGWQEIGNFSDIPQSDWNESNPSSLAYILNRPEINQEICKGYEISEVNINKNYIATIGLVSDWKAGDRVAFDIGKTLTYGFTIKSFEISPNSDSTYITINEPIPEPTAEQGETMYILNLDNPKKGNFVVGSDSFS